MQEQFTIQNYNLNSTSAGCSIFVANHNTTSAEVLVCGLLDYQRIWENVYMGPYMGAYMGPYALMNFVVLFIT